MKTENTQKRIVFNCIRDSSDNIAVELDLPSLKDDAHSTASNLFKQLKWDGDVVRMVLAA